MAEDQWGTCRSCHLKATIIKLGSSEKPTIRQVSDTRPFVCHQTALLCGCPAQDHSRYNSLHGPSAENGGKELIFASLLPTTTDCRHTYWWLAVSYIRLARTHQHWMQLLCGQIPVETTALTSSWAQRTAFLSHLIASSRSHDLRRTLERTLCNCITCGSWLGRLWSQLHTGQ